MRETISILKYGFMLFLLITGIVSIFSTETYFVNSVNSLSIPIFAFSISILFVKSNQYARTEVMKQIENKDESIKHLKIDIDKKEKRLNGATCNSRIDETQNVIENMKQLNQLYNENVYFYKYFRKIDFFTKAFNVIAILSFSWCLLSLTGLFRITWNFIWVNIFSLALVFFDFFILDDLMSKMVGNKVKHFREQAEKEMSKNEE